MYMVCDRGIDFNRNTRRVSGNLYKGKQFLQEQALCDAYVLIYMLLNETLKPYIY